MDIYGRLLMSIFFYGDIQTIHFIFAVSRSKSLFLLQVK